MKYKCDGGPLGSDYIFSVILGTGGTQAYDVFASLLVVVVPFLTLFRGHGCSIRPPLVHRTTLVAERTCPLHHTWCYITAEVCGSLVASATLARIHLEGVRRFCRSNIYGIVETNIEVSDTSKRYHRVMFERVYHKRIVSAVSHSDRSMLILLLAICAIHRPCVAYIHHGSSRPVTPLDALKANMSISCIYGSILRRVCLI